MKTSKYIFLALAAILLMVSCGKKEKKSYDEMASSGFTTRTENLRANLKAFAQKGTLVGQEYATLEGIGWQCDSDRSDMRSICGDRPAAIAYELAGIETGQKTNRDGLPFSELRRDVLENFRRGALIAMNWTCPDYHGDEAVLKQYTQNLAKFLDSLQNDYGIKAPVVLFLYPLDGQSWYCSLSKEDYAKLYKQTQELLDDFDTTNTVFGYSETFRQNTDYMARLSGCEVDVVNATCLQPQTDTDPAHYAANLQSAIEKALPLATEHNCAFGLTTGMESVPDSSIFAGVILPQLKAHHVAYLLFGGNHGELKDGHFYLPCPGDGNDKIHGFMQLFNDDVTVFMSRLNGLYLEH